MSSHQIIGFYVDHISDMLKLGPWTIQYRPGVYKHLLSSDIIERPVDWYCERVWLQSTQSTYWILRPTLCNAEKSDRRLPINHWWPDWYDGRHLDIQNVQWNYAYFLMFKLFTQSGYLKASQITHHNKCRVILLKLWWTYFDDTPAVVCWSQWEQSDNWCQSHAQNIKTLSPYGDILTLWGLN